MEASACAAPEPSAWIDAPRLINVSRRSAFQVRRRPRSPPLACRSGGLSLSAAAAAAGLRTGPPGVRVPIAVATDCNPGTSPLTSPLLAMNMAATLFHLTVAECIAGVTRNAASALGLAHEIGTLEAGKRCDLAIWDIDRPAELVYRVGFNSLWRRIHTGT